MSKRVLPESNHRNKRVVQSNLISVAPLFKSVNFGSCNEKEAMRVDLD